MRIDKAWPAQQLLDIINAPDSRVHFSQFGEDTFLADLLHHQPNGFYVDVGCHDPFRYSNTYLLWKVLNWRGINIDADSRAIARFNAARPNDINLHLGIGPEESTATFTLFGDGAVNTFDAETASRQAINFGPPTTEVVNIHTLRSVLDQYLPPDTEIGYLNIDCEGLDEKVLQSNDWTKYRPRIITVELQGFNLERAADHPAVVYLNKNGYRLSSYFFATALFLRVDMIR